jgi:hypothetical protein
MSPAEECQVSNPYGAGSTPTPDDRPSVGPPIADGQPYRLQLGASPDPGMPDHALIPRVGPEQGRRNTWTLLLVGILGAILMIALIPTLLRLGDRIAEDRARDRAGFVENEVEPEENPPAFLSVDVGERFDLGDYTFSVDKVTVDADEMIASVQAHNDPPAGQYVLVDLTVEHSGNGEGDPFFDVDYEFVSSDGTQYTSADCQAALPIDRFALPELEESGALQFQVCVDVPPEDVDSGRPLVKSRFVEDGVQGVYVTLN